MQEPSTSFKLLFTFLVNLTVVTADSTFRRRRLQSKRSELINKKMDKKAEDDYPKHKGNPSPSKESLEEPNDEKAGMSLNRVIIISIIIMAIAFFLIFRNT